MSAGTARYADLVYGGNPVSRPTSRTAEEPNEATDSTSNDQPPAYPLFGDTATPAKGTVDVHRRAAALIEQGYNRWEAYRQAVREVARYEMLARCDRCRVYRPELHCQQDTSGRYEAVCNYCL